jgi:hypothetical protein
MTSPMESWRRVWREGIAPQLSVDSLEALREALATADPRLIQGVTVQPPPILCCADWPPEAADAIAFAYWKGDGLNTVAELEEAFARTCAEIDLRLGEPAACRYWTNHWDDTPRAELFAEVLEEIERTLAERLVIA